MKLLLLFLTSITVTSAFSEVDTLDLDLDKAALNMKKCRKYLHLDDFRKISSPPHHLWTKADSIFLMYDDSLYLRISEKGHVRLEGLRVYSEISGTMRMYNKKGKLVREEFRGRLMSAESHDDEYVADEMPGAMSATDYRNGAIVRKTERVIVWIEGKGWGVATTTGTYRNGRQTGTREKRKAYR